MKKTLLFSTILFFIAFSGQAQDWHYSQFMTNRVAMNPAHTGDFDQDYRLSFLYRLQWPGIDAKFTNTSAAGDVKLNVGPGKLGLGGLFVQENFPDGRFSQVAAGVSSAYHFHLDYPQRHKISLGFQAGLVSKTFNPDAGLEFGNQFENFEFNPTISSEEDLNEITLNSFNMNIGAKYEFLLSYRTNIRAGLTLFSVTTPDESFVTTTNTNELGIRYLSHLEVDYMLTEKIIASPKILYTNQSRGEDINVGALLTYKLKPDFFLNGGVFYRWKDASIIHFGAAWKNLVLRGSIDLTTSSLNDVSDISTQDFSAPRAYEIGLIWSGLFKQNKNARVTIPCGIF